MKATDIARLESDNKNGIFLTRDRLFWQAWEVSAFLFIRHLRNYKTHKRFYRNAGMELVYLGFPKTALEDVIKQAVSAGYSVERHADSKITIKGLPNADGFEDWKLSLTKNGKKIDGAPFQANSENHAANSSRETVYRPESEENTYFLPIYKTAYGMTLDVFQIAARINRNLKYSLGNRIIEECISSLREIHLLVNLRAGGDIRNAVSGVLHSLESLRLFLRLLKDTHQINIKRFIKLNENIEEIIRQMRKWIQGGRPA